MPEKCSIATYMTSTGWGYTKPAKHQEDGNWWCGAHLPSKVKAKREAEAVKRRSEFDEQVARARKRLESQEFLERKAAAYDQIATVWNDEHLTEADSVHQTFAIIRQIEES